MLPSIEELIVIETTPLNEVLRIIDTAAQGICFVIDGNKKLVGTITDGDIRRALINGQQLSEPAKTVMFTDFISLPVGTAQSEINKILSTKIRHIPLVDENNTPVDYACIHRHNRFPVMEPLLEGNEMEYVVNCIKTNWISSQGKYVTQFEEMIAQYCETPFALAVSNGTVALHLALESFNIGPGDEVIVPDLTFAATINAVIYTGATPVIVDINPDTWNISTEEIKQAITPQTKAIIPVHLYGLPADMEEIMAIAKEHQLLVIEDAAEALGSDYNNQKSGGIGDAAIFSFFGNKTITTGEGGMITFRNEAAYQKAKILRDHGMSKEKRYWHDLVGYNYRLTNLQAAIGVAQMERIDQIVKQKQEIGNRYNRLLANENILQLPAEVSGATNTYWLYTFLLKNEDTISRDLLMERLRKNGIDTRPFFYPLHQMPPYQKFYKKIPENSVSVSKRGICLPSYLSLSEEAIEFICTTLKKQLSPVQSAQ